jgi:hypothetical protein
VRRASVLGLTFAGIACFTTLCLVGLVLAPHLEFSPPVDADGTMQSKQTFIIGAPFDLRVLSGCSLRPLRSLPRPVLHPAFL